MCVPAPPVRSDLGALRADVRRPASMAIKELSFGFFGSFQCRLATDPDPSSSSPNGPVPDGAPAGFGPFSRPGKGWTYDFDEVAFDRVIRLSGPVSLRNGLVDPWRDVRSHGVRINRGAGLVDAPGDPLAGLTVSLGPQVKFDSATGGGPANEALVGFEFSVGSSLVATAPATPQIRTNVSVAQSDAWKGEYSTVKPQRATTISNRARKAVLEERMPWYCNVFGSYMGTVDGTVLSPPRLAATGGVLKEIAAQTGGGSLGAARGRWEFHVDFYRFDPDTLVGTVNGWVRATF